ncbi:hypothetical protein L226DRAFT_573266 [Lentinus tigrinus ALCF2SS1-7]|uniref:Uncharacterized protein n=1 Tax=Lentinus tigrinus ALCF2SS1-6 TaxID=1328759 RepID=A0A5C2S565_9APHY|nr:hypothetical protein L227DRAFT_613177 [Lentinus tigrinus ALCF2SS1-6]RPD72200.1 hypothetical protein L226DRAFT_573266 [Lentinus tigrinus ALCF2SS1-7]
MALRENAEPNRRVLPTQTHRQTSSSSLSRLRSPPPSLRRPWPVLGGAGGAGRAGEAGLGGWGAFEDAKRELETQNAKSAFDVEVPDGHAHPTGLHSFLDLSLVCADGPRECRTEPGREQPIANGTHPRRAPAPAARIEQSVSRTGTRGEQHSSSSDSPHASPLMAIPPRSCAPGRGSLRPSPNSSRCSLLRIHPPVAAANIPVPRPNAQHVSSQSASASSPVRPANVTHHATPRLPSASPRSRP